MGAPDPFAFDATRLLLAEGGRRYTQSTMSYVSVAGLTAALGELLAVGTDALAAHAAALRQRLLAGVRPSGWRAFRDPDDPSACPHLLSLARAGDDTTSTLARLADAGILCGARGGRVRVSLAPYNDASDIDALITALD
jgi:selenocysteine lyase/cysteine desulfurase